MKILEIGLAQSSVAAISADRHMVVGCDAADSNDLFQYIDCEAPDVIAADIDKHPWLISEIQSLRRRSVSVPVVALASTNCLSRGERRAEFLEIGGNDFLEKPIEHRELMASLDSLHRLYSKSLLGRSVSVKAGSATVQVDITKGCVTVDDIRLTLTPMEYKLLELMLLHKGQLVTKKAIQDTLYGFLDVPENNCIQVLMVRIRQKLTAVNSATADLIETVRRSGYRLNDESL